MKDLGPAVEWLIAPFVVHEHRLFAACLPRIHHSDFHKSFSIRPYMGRLIDKPLLKIPLSLAALNLINDYASGFEIVYDSILIRKLKMSRISDNFIKFCLDIIALIGPKVLIYRDFISFNFYF